MKIIIEGTAEEIQALMQKSSAVNRALVINSFPEDSNQILRKITPWS